jgi:protein arginine kinase activator
LLNIHGDLKYTGKVPKSGVANSKQLTELIKLRREMDQAVSSEEYETASKLRDRIQKIERAAKKSASSK